MSLLLPKQNYLRSKPFRKWLSGLPCLVCKIEGRSQAAHLGKGGRGIKGHDYECAPLCHSKFNEWGQLVNGCHSELDQYKRVRYWDENLLRAKQTMTQAYYLWKEGRFDEAEIIVRAF